MKYFVNFVISDSNSGVWFEEMNTATVEAGSAWEAFVNAVMLTQNANRPDDDPKRWSFNRAYAEIYGDESTYFTATALNLGTGQQEDIASPIWKANKLKVERDKVLKAIDAIDTISEPFPAVDIHNLTDVNAKELLRGLQYLKGYYESMAQKLETDRAAAEAYSRGMLEKGREEIKAEDERLQTAKKK